MIGGRAYDAWTLRMQRATRLVSNEDELRDAITALSGVGSSFNRLKGGGTILIIGPMLVSRTITIPVSCPGLTIAAASRFPIVPAPGLTVMFDARAEYCTIRDLLVVAGINGAVCTTLVTAHDPAVSGRSCVGLRILGNVAFTRNLFQDLSAGQASFMHVESNRLGQPDGILPTTDAVLIDSFGCLVANNDFVPGAGGRGVAVTANGGACRIEGNYLSGRSINTSLSSGANSLAANSSPGTKTLAATDVDDDSHGPGRLIRAPQVLTAGTSYAKPAGCNRIVVELVGGGGGGGGCSSAASSAACGGGGASGAYTEKSYDVSALAGPFTYAIGGAGTAGANTGAAGGAGGDTTFTDGTTLVTAKGGLGGNGQTAATTAGFVAGGAGQLATNGDVNGAGAPGEAAQRLSGTAAISGMGGSSDWGGGGLALLAAGAGNAGKGFGAGGGGGLVLNASAAVVGGTGTAGAIRVWEFT